MGTGYQDMTSYQDLVSHPIKRTEVIGQPRFEVKDLPTGTGFAVVVYAVNEKVSFHLKKKPTKNCAGENVFNGPLVIVHKNPPSLEKQKADCNCIVSNLHLVQ